MSPKNLDELIDGDVDRTNTPAEAEALAQAVARDPALAEHLEVHRHAAGAVEDLGREEPPPGLVAAVMAAVRSRAAGGAHQLSPWGRVVRFRAPEIGSPVVRRRKWTGGGSMASRKVLLGIAAVAVIAIAFFAVKGFPPVGPGAEGTVGAAKRYQSQQIEGKDIVLQDPGVQLLLQSDSFRKLIADKEARAVLSSKDFQKAMSDASVQAFVAQLARDQALAGAVTNAARDGAVQNLMQKAASDQALLGALDKALDNAAVAKALNGAASQAASQASARAVAQAVNGATNNAAAAALLSLASQNAAFARLAGNEAFQKALNDQAFAGLMANANFAGLIADPAFASALQDRAVQNAISNGALSAAVQSAAAGADNALAGGNR
jgi:hypothetical protein